MLHRWLCAIALLSMGLCSQSSAETWPTKPIRAIVPYSPGSATDIIPRTVFAQVEKQLGQPIIIENRDGGASTIGTAAVAKSEPDGYTFLVASSAYTTVPLTVANLPYDPVRDLTAVIPLANMANVLVISPAKGIKTVGEFVTAARAQRGSMNYVTIGAGSAAHLNSERFRLAARFEAQPIPFKGSPAGLTEVVAGRVDFYFCPLLPALGLIRDGKLTALAVSSSQRAPNLPDVPTTVEAGFPNSEYNFWFGVFAPAKTPPEIIQRLYEEIAKALQDPGVREKLAKLAVQPMPMTPAQFNDYVRKELEQNAALVKAAGIKPQ
ncbi:MAG: tripartite tricarboxylate transporter substrate binding protein [Rhizobiales bacterium]|nr:tripartite tricarboxylate transporter substrate binding protein [Hyphomicrobiales bacterium]